MKKRNQTIKKLFYWNIVISLLIAFLDSVRVISAYNIQKPISDTLSFILISFLIYFLMFISISIFVVLINSLLKGYFDRKFTLFKFNLILDIVLVIILLLLQFNLEPVIFKNPHKKSFNLDESYPNIVLITLDTLRQDHLSSTGNNNLTTPGIDYFSKNGITFSDAHCQIPVTTPSHSSILSGLNPYTHGSRNNGSNINVNIETLPQFFAKMGYKTSAFVSSSTLKAKLSGLDRGFHHYDELLCPRYWDQRIYFTLFGRLAFRLKLYQTVERTAERTYESFQHWIKGNKKEKFFLWLHFFDSHAPYIKHENISSAYYEGESFNLKADYNLINSIYDGVFKPSDEQMEYLISLYDGEI